MKQKSIEEIYLIQYGQDSDEYVYAYCRKCGGNKGRSAPNKELHTIEHFKKLNPKVKTIECHNCGKKIF